METSTTHSKHSGPRFRKIAMAVTLGIVIGAFTVGSLHADEHHGDHDRGRGHVERHEFRGHDYDRGPTIVYSEPDYYYAPAPDYYEAPEPDYYYYAPPPDYYPQRPSEGIHLFFGF